MCMAILSYTFIFDIILIDRTSEVVEMFNGYFLKIGNYIPTIKREGLKITPRIVQVTETKVLASGKLSVKKLQHQPTILNIDFPIMTFEQARKLKRVFRGEETGEDEMYLTVEWYDIEEDNYKIGTFYHTDLVYTPVWYSNQWMALVDSISLHEY